MRALLGPAFVLLLPLAVWPGLERPFSAPKLLILAVGSAALGVAGLRRPVGGVPPALRWAALAWGASFVVAGVTAPFPALPALALGLLAPLFAVMLVRAGVPPASVLVAQAVGATVCAAVALLQWAGLDPLAQIGWHVPVEGASVRMRVYGTLGNPNFVGVLMAMSVPLTVAVRTVAQVPSRQRLAETALALQALALVATGSRGAVLGLGAAMATYALLRWSRRVRLGMIPLLVFAAVAVAVSPARPLDTTAAGRLHLWRIVVPHALDAPVTGLGPGAVELAFPEWQRGAARDGVRDRRFAGLTDHVHNDYLEALVERGVPGLVTLLLPPLLVALALLRRPWPTTPLLAGCAAAMVAVAACALVDFPLARPTELAWWWVAFATCCRHADAGVGRARGVRPSHPPVAGGSSERRSGPHFRAIDRHFRAMGITPTP